MDISTKSWFKKIFSRAMVFNIHSFSSFEGTPHKEVPDFVSQSTMERCRNMMRIKIANYMMVATALGCIAMVYIGKEAAKRGDSITKRNLEWHTKMEAEMDIKNK